MLVGLTRAQEAYSAGMTHVLAMVYHAPFMFLIQRFLLFETALCGSDNPFRKLANPRAFKRQCSPVVLTHFVADETMEIMRPCPVFNRDTAANVGSLNDVLVMDSETRRRPDPANDPLKLDPQS